MVRSQGQPPGVKGSPRQQAAQAESPSLTAARDEFCPQPQWSRKLIAAQPGLQM